MTTDELPVLLIDDDDISLTFYRTVLKANGINNLKEFKDSRTVLPFLSSGDALLVLLDLNMPHISGVDLLSKINEDHPNLPVIVITGDNKVDMAVECMKKGAFDYLVKPVKNDRLYTVVKHAIEIYTLKKEVNKLSTQVLTGEVKNPDAFSEIITKNTAMKSIFKYIEAIAPSPKTVLITGESGTGKELIARAIHKLSRKNDKFVPVNVAGLDDTVFSDTLFGHKRGAYTGADTERKGLIEQASGGTLFLDEIGDLDTTSQLKLLRLLQEGEYYPLGSDKSEKSTANIVAATNADLKSMLDSGKFRNDLYYRLISHHINIPPLRERLDDIPLLVDHFIAEAANAFSKQKPTVPKEINTLLSTYYFRGNIRELQSMIFDAIGLYESGILSLNYFREYIKNHSRQSDNMYVNINTSNQVLSYSDRIPTLKEAEDFLISEALKKAKGNQSIAADILGVNQSTLSRRLKKKDEE